MVGSLGRLWVDCEEFANPESVRDRIADQLRLLVPDADVCHELTETVFEYYTREIEGWRSWFDDPTWLTSPRTVFYDMHDRTFLQNNTGEGYTFSVGLRSAFHTQRWNARFVENPNCYSGWEATLA